MVEKKSDLFALGIWLAFNPEIWPLLLLIIAIISFLFHIIIYQYTLDSPENKNSKPKWALSTFLHRQYREEIKKPLHVSMFEAFEVTLQPLLGQPLSATQITHRPRRLLKLLLIIWWFSSLIISTLYNTSLITSLINPISPKEPESLQDLLDFGYRFKAAGKQGAFFELVKSVSEIPGANGDDDETDIPAEELLNGASNEERKTVRLIKQISDRLLTEGSGRSTSLIAYVIGESAVKGIKWDKKEIGFSQIKIIRERLFLTTYAWPTQRHAPFKKKIDSALGRLNSAGLIEYWYHEFGRRDSKEPRSVELRLREKLGQIHLNMQVLQGAFIFLVFGHAFGGLILGVEHLTKRYKFRFFTKDELCYFYKKISSNIKRMYAKHFAAEHEDLQLRRKKNRMRFKGAVRTVTTFRKKDVDYPYLK